jgi:hypothetical protein
MPTVHFSKVTMYLTLAVVLLLFNSFCLVRWSSFQIVPPTRRSTMMTPADDEIQELHPRWIRGSMSAGAPHLPCPHQPEPEQEHMHILYGGHGSHPGFLAELQASIKSVLLNAPLDYPMDVHLLVDTEAQDAVAAILDDHVHLADWRTRQAVTVHTYNVESYVRNWTDVIDATYQHFPPDMDHFRHTVGAYYRLFADDVLNATTIDDVLYMDSDVIVMSNLDRLWRDIRSKRPQHQYHFQWGKEQCSGLLVINIQKLKDFWKRIKDYDLLTLRGFASVRDAQKMVRQRGLGDQFLIRSMQLTEAELIGHLPDEWDVSANDGPWWNITRNGTGVVEDRPRGVGMLHFNGGGSSKLSAFEGHPFLMENNPDAPANNDYGSTWKLAHFYNRLDWKWARYMVESQVRSSDGGHPVKIHHYGRRV